MPIALAHRPVTLPLSKPFRISRGAVDEYHVVEVALTHDGVTGYGEATPDDHFGETLETVAAFCDAAGALLGDAPFALEAIERRLRGELGSGNRAAMAAVDAALHDLIGKKLGVPVWKLIGTAAAGPPTVWTIVLADPHAMARGAAEADAGGRFRALKLKLGGRDGLDVQRVRAVREATSLPMQVDVNEYWALDEAVANIEELASLGVSYVEQPLPAGDPGGAELRRRSALPVYVDEDCHTLADVARCAEVAHGINIKLAKSGGIREAIRMVHAARALGLGVMLGCMGESSLGIAAGCPVAPLCDHVDLDGNLPLSADPWQGVELVDGVQVASDAPGLGGDAPVNDVRPYVVLAEGWSHDPQAAKTMHGVLRYASDPTVAIVDSKREAGATVDGVPVVDSVRAAMEFGPARAIVGVAPSGGALDEAWISLLLEAIECGLDVEAGMHTRLGENERLVHAASARGVVLTDLRTPPAKPHIPTGANLTLDATVVHTVGSDCAIGKKTMALELHAEALRQGRRSVFVPTGQTGVAIAGWGTAIDTVPADFIAGVAEDLVVEGATRGDLLWVEGQGAIVHPHYSGVTLGLYHGCAPDFLILCHRVGDTHLGELPGHPILPLRRLIDIYEGIALPVKPARVVGIALNTARLESDDEARAAVEAAADETGLPAGDPVRFDAKPLVDGVLAA